MATYSALPSTLNLVATVGNDFTLSLTVTESGSPWVATGATLATDIIDSSGAVVATDFTTAASTGSVTLSLTDTQTSTLGVGVYSYRLSVTKSSLTRDWIAGTLSIVEAGQGGTSTSSASLSISNSAVTLGITSLVAPEAAQISVADADNYYAGDTVEEVLAEIPTREQTLWPWGGYDVLPRDFATGTTVVTLVKDKYAFRTFVAPADMVVTGVQMASTATVSAGLTLCRYFLAQVTPVVDDATYARWRYTFLARTASDTTMFNSANTLYSRSFSSTGGWPTSVRLIKGQTYAVGYMISGTTAPTVVSAPAFMRPQINVVSTTDPLMGGYPAGIEAYTDLPPYVAAASTIYDGVGSSPWYNLIADPTSTKARPVDTVMLGDSYVRTFGGWAAEGNTRAGSPLSLSFWAGYSGQQTDYILTQIATTTVRRPELVIVSCGINDVANTVSASTIQDNLTAIATALTAAGAKVILCTIPPSTFMDAGELTTLATVNTWLKSTFSMTNVWVSDTGNALTTGDGVTRNASLYTDGAHPNFAGCAAMGAVLAVTIALATA